jgi:hypothetical protein
LNHAHPAEIEGRIAYLEALSRNPPELETHAQGAQPRRCSAKVRHAEMGPVGTSADSTGTHSSAASARASTGVLGSAGELESNGLSTTPGMET